MTVKLFKFFLGVLLCGSTTHGFATAYVWKGTTNNSWGTNTNWQPNGVPGSADVVTFDNTCTSCNCNLSAATAVAGFTITSGYTGTFSQGSFNLTVGANGFVMAGGTYTTTTGNLTIGTGGFNRTGGTFNAGTGTVIFNSTSTVTGSTSFNNATFTSGMTGVTITISSGTTFTVSGTLTLGTGDAPTTVNTGSISALGNITLSGSNVFSGSATITANGTGSQTLTGGGASLKLPNFVINKSSGTLSLSGTIGAGGNWTYTAGTVSAGTSTVVLNGTSQTIAGTHTLNTVDLDVAANSTVTISNALTLAGDLNLKGGVNSITINTGTVNVAGNLSVTNTSTTSVGGGSALIVLNGSGTQTLTGPGSSNGLALPKVEINKSAGTLNLASTIPVRNDWTYTAGTISAGTSTVVFRDGLTLGGSNHSLANVTITNTATSTLTIANTTTVTVTGTLMTAGTNALYINSGGSGTINLTGTTFSVTNSSSSGGGTGTIQLSGTAAQTITANNGPTGRLCNFRDAKSGTGAITLNDTTQVVGNVEFFGTVNHLLNSGTNGVLEAYGNISFNSGTQLGGGSALFAIRGSANQTLTGNGGGNGTFPHFTINKSGGTLSLVNNCRVLGNFTHTAGTIDPGTSSVLMMANGATSYTISTASTLNLYNISISNVTSISPTGTLTLSGNLNANTVTFNPSRARFAAGSGTITLTGNWIDANVFYCNTSTVLFTGSATTHTLSGTSAQTFFNITLNTSTATDAVNITTPIQVNNTLTLTKGILKSTNSSLLTIPAGAGTTGASTNSFVEASLKKIGNTAFTFPTGAGTNYQPITMSAPQVSTDAFTAKYFNTGQAYGSTRDTLLDSLSTCEYWDLDRNVGTSTVTVTLGWNSNSCATDSAHHMRVAYWDGAKWANVGGYSSTGNQTQGTITSSARSSFGHFTIGHYFYCKYIINFQAHAGPNRSLASGTTAIIGANPVATGNGVNYSLVTASWSPTTALSNFNGAYTGSAVCAATSTTTYWVTASYGWCKASSSVTVYVNNMPAVALLRKVPDGHFYNLQSGMLHFKVEGEYNASSLTYNVYDKSNAVVASNSANNIANTTSLVAGDNRLYLNVGTSSLPVGNYLLEVINEKNEKFYLRFKK